MKRRSFNIAKENLLKYMYTGSSSIRQSIKDGARLNDIDEAIKT